MNNNLIWSIFKQQFPLFSHKQTATPSAIRSLYTDILCTDITAEPILQSLSLNYETAHYGVFLQCNADQQGWEKEGTRTKPPQWDILCSKVVRASITTTMSKISWQGDNRGAGEKERWKSFNAHVLCRSWFVWRKLQHNSQNLSEPGGNLTYHLV